VNLYSDKVFVFVGEKGNLGDNNRGTVVVYDGRYLLFRFHQVGFRYSGQLSGAVTYADENITTRVIGESHDGFCQIGGGGQFLFELQSPAFGFVQNILDHIGYLSGKNIHQK
jgi:hypothetical protein